MPFTQSCRSDLRRLATHRVRFAAIKIHRQNRTLHALSCDDLQPINFVSAGRRCTRYHSKHHHAKRRERCPPPPP
jgi:hypothetical protein